MTYKVLLPEDIEEENKKYLRDNDFAVIMGTGLDEATVCADIKDCDAVIVRNIQYTKKIMAAGKKLKIMAVHGAGFDNVDIAAATELGIQVVNAPGANAEGVAEYTIGLMLALACRFQAADQAVRSQDWDYRNRDKRLDFSDRIVGIVGYGHIGKKVAAYLNNSFQPQIVVYDPLYVGAKDFGKIHFTASLEEVLQAADILTVHVPLDNTTRNMLGAKQFAMLKKGSILINCARGGVCVEADLCQALTSGQLAGAGIDVYASEPFNTKNPLLAAPNVIFSPHWAGLSLTDVRRMGLYAAQGIVEFFSGQPLSYPVNTLKK